MRPEFQALLFFLRKIGVPVEVRRDSRAGCFLPGLWFEHGELRVCPTEAHPGDLLHDAGHWALTPARLRGLLGVGDYTVRPEYVEATNAFYREHQHALDAPEAQALIYAGEHEAVAWSYAAALAAGVDPRLPFEQGFLVNTVRYGGEEVLTALQDGSHIGIPGLIKAGLCAPGGFPQLTLWVQT